MERHAGNAPRFALQQTHDGCGAAYNPAKYAETASALLHNVARIRARIRAVGETDRGLVWRRCQSLAEISSRRPAVSLPQVPRQSRFEETDPAPRTRASRYYCNGIPTIHRR